MNNPGPLYTWILIGSTVLVWALYDVWVGVNYGGDATISWQIATYAKRYPIIALVAGILMGHFFWQMNLPTIQAWRGK